MRYRHIWLPVLTFGIPAFAQSPISLASAPTFSVASFKPSREGRSAILQPMRDGFHGTGLTLHMLIANAYENSRIEGEPAWANLDRYDFDAKLDPPFHAGGALSNAEAHTLDLALKDLLKERCDLQAHTKTALIPAYELVVDAKSRVRPTPGKPNDPDLPAGSLRLLQGKVIGQGVSLERLAGLLSLQLGRPVHDETHLAGSYDFTLQWQADDDLASQTVLIAPLAPPSADDPRAQIPSALEKQLGLKLVPAKARVQVLVVDHLERPASN